MGQQTQWPNVHSVDAGQARGDVMDHTLSSVSALAPLQSGLHQVDSSNVKPASQAKAATLKALETPPTKWVKHGDLGHAAK